MSAASKLPAFAVCGILLLVSFNLFAAEGPSETRQEITLRVAIKSDIATTNILAANDLWTRGILSPVYMIVGMLSPDLTENYPYILKGVDADENGVLDSDEHGVFNKEGGLNPRSVTAYYDLNGVYFHDGVQATKEDLLFSYHLEALAGTGDVFWNSLDVVKDKSSLEGSNYSSDRWLWVYPVDDVWDLGVPVGGNSSLTFALHFELQSDYYAFVDNTLSSLRLFPRHVWEETGKLCLVAEGGVCSVWETPLHDDFGRAYDPVTANGVPEAMVDSFNEEAARSWIPDARHVIGTGPFGFAEWVKGSYIRLDRYEDFFVDAVDRDGSKYMRIPYVDSILFKIYKTDQMAVFALQVGEVDIVSWSVPPQYTLWLQQDPNVSISSTAEKGFTYLGYNMRESPFGYPDNDPTAGDDGLWLRKAIAHVIDKKTIVMALLQNFGVAGDQPMSPASVKWYNASVTKYDYNLQAARQILDDHYTESYQGGPGLGWSGGWRNLPTIGNQKIEILCPQADYDPIRAQACNMIASDMRLVGLNAEANLVAFGEIVEKLNNRDMQMWVLGWRIGSDPPDYYHAFFYSGNARAGQNYPGFQNETFDRLITEARAELDLEKQTKIIKQCSGLLTEAQPYDVLYFRTNVIPYRQDRLTNFTGGLIGSDIWELVWTLIGMHPPFIVDMSLAINAPSAVQAGSTTSFHVILRDNLGVLPGVRVDMCVEAWSWWDPGNISIDEDRGRCVSGTTDAGGKISALYEAPDIGDLEEMRVMIHAQAKSGYRKSNHAQTSITVYPKEKQFLSVLMRMTAGDIVALGYALPFKVEVTDQNGMRLDGVAVNLTSFPEGLTLKPGTGTTVGGLLEGIIEPPSEIELGFDQVRFNIVAGAQLEGYEPTTGIAQIVVIEMSPASDSPPPAPTYAEISLVLIAVMVSAAVVLAVIRLRENRK